MEEFHSTRRTNFTFLFLVATSLFFLTARFSNTVLGIKNLLFYIVSPTQENSAKVISLSRHLSENIKSIVAAHQENILLKEKLQQYALLDNEWARTSEENIRLRNLADFQPPEKHKTITAKVISRDPASWFQWAIIDKGKKDGVDIDSAVLGMSGNDICVFGRIGDVYNNASKVVLITNPLFAVPALLGTNNEDGLLEGQNNALLKMNYLLSKDKIVEGDKVFTSPLSLAVPAKILIGSVLGLTTSEDERFVSAIVKPAAQLGTLREVIVLVSDGYSQKKILSSQFKEPSRLEKEIITKEQK